MPFAPQQSLGSRADKKASIQTADDGVEWQDEAPNAWKGGEGKIGEEWRRVRVKRAASPPVLSPSFPFQSCNPAFVAPSILIMI